jgi:spore coat protein U-like protein
MKWRTFVTFTAVLFSSHAVAEAGQRSAQFEVSLVVVEPEVTVSATPLYFGNALPNYYSRSSSTITINASAGALYSIALDRGSTPPTPGAEDQRLMAGPLSNLPYRLFTDAGYDWGDDGITNSYPSVAGFGSGTDQPYTVNGEAAVFSTTPPGEYVDLVTVTVNF